MKKTLTSIFILILFVQLANCQKTIRAKKVLGKPVRFESPLGYNDQSQIKFFVEQRGKRLKSPWIVISDRADNVVYESPNGEPLDFILDFKDYFYVLDDKKEWIHIAKIKPKPRKLKISKDAEVLDYGWVEKSKMLLWTRGLINPQSRIHQKAFLLNKAIDIKRLIDSKQDLKKNLAKIYTHPTKSDVIEEKHIYEFYFILKKDEHRVLLAKEATLNTYMLDETIIGWVNSNRLEEWNTRIALEPNFEKEAFEERKADPNKRLIGYGDEDGANFHGKMGIPYEGHIVWDNDPVKLSRDQLDSETGRRFKGTVVRFPLFKKVGNIYRSGVIGNINVKTFGAQMDTISEIDYSAIQKKIEGMKISGNNYDVVFMIEGREDLEFVKKSVLNTIDKIKKKNNDINYRFGIVVYRDSYDKKDGKIFMNLSLTSNYNKIIEFLSNTVFGSANDFDDWTSIYYNLKQAILREGFTKEHTNILIVVGNGGDYISSKSRRIRAKKDKDETFIKSKKIINLLTDFNINISFVQPINEGTEPYRGFLRQARRLILEPAKKQFNIYRNINNYVPDLELNNPYIDEVYNTKTVKLIGGSNYGQISWPFENNKYSESKITNILYRCIDNIEQSKSSFFKELSNVFIKGNSFENSAGSLAAPMAKFLNEIMGKNLNKDVIKKLLKEKYKLYTGVYLPVKIKGAKYPTTSYVLFMPSNELEEYISQLKKLAVAADNDISKQREELYNTLIALLNQYTGFDMSKSEIKKATLDDLRNKMQGLTSEGVTLTGFQNFRLQDIRDERKMSDEEVEAFGETILSKLKRLNKILSLKGKYEFSYTTETNTYFWIPIDYTL